MVGLIIPNVEMGKLRLKEQLPYCRVVGQGLQSWCVEPEPPRAGRFPHWTFPSPVCGRGAGLAADTCQVVCDCEDVWVTVSVRLSVGANVRSFFP